MSAPQADSNKINRKVESNNSSQKDVLSGKSEQSDSPAKTRHMRSASPTPSQEVLRLKKYRVQLLLESEREKERLEKARSERVKKQQEGKRGSPEPGTPKNEKKRDPVSKLLEIRSTWAKAQSDLLERTEANSKELEAHLKHFQDQRLSYLEERARNNRSHLAEVRECKSHLNQEEEQQMLMKLEEMRRKMEKSRQLHSALIQSRSQSAARRRGTAGSLSPAHATEDETLLKYLRKLQSGSSRQVKAKLEDLKEKEALKQAKLERWKKVESNQKSQQQKVMEWTKSIEEKHNVLMATIESRISENLRTVACRSELQRERADMCHLNRTKLQRLQTSRQADLLSKWVQVGRRVEALKQQRAISVEQHRDKQHSNMIEKERLYEVLQVVAKSPQSRKAQKLLKYLED